jgi:cytochrome c-type biogenesis protein CcmH/NrfF
MTRLACLILAAVAVFPAASWAAKVNISDVEDEVMCPICGTLLELSDSPQARREKAFIAEMIAAGKSKAEIEDALVAEYGPGVLAEPEGSGFELSAYLVPAIALLVTAVALAVGVARWRRHGGGGGTPAAGGDGPGDEDSARLDADIARYDL